MIEVKNLAKDYGEHHALKGISFSVDSGRIAGLLGPNGAGKSTTMNIMTGCLTPTSGQVIIDGCDMDQDPVRAKEKIGYLPELPPLYEDMTVREYLGFVCDLKKVKGKEKKTAVEEVMEAVKVTELSGRLIRNLSKGYKQRVGLAQALIGNPPVIILDEPTVGLDPNQIIEMRELIRSLGNKHTVILSSHILSEVNAVCDQVLIIDDGRLVAEDTPEHLSDHYADRDRLLLEVRGSSEEVSRILEGSPLVESFELFGEAEGIVNVKVESASDKDIRDELFFLFADKRLAIVKLERESVSLEDVFLKLTGQDEEKEDE